jgi:hypothetical protein
MLYPKWEGPLRQARQETNQYKLLKLIGEAEMAIFQRFQELPANADGHEESQAIQAACDELLRLKSERLGWPILTGKCQEVRKGVRAEVRTAGDVSFQD